jgi:hypothetical protein
MKMAPCKLYRKSKITSISPPFSRSYVIREKKKPVGVRVAELNRTRKKRQEENDRNSKLTIFAEVSVWLCTAHLQIDTIDIVGRNR